MKGGNKDMSFLACDEQYTDHLSDESRLCGTADSISFPRSVQEAQSQIAELAAEGIPVTVQGGRTGICGASVPTTGHILDVSRLNHITALRQDRPGNFLVDVEPGLQLQELKSSLMLCSFNTEFLDQESIDTISALRQAAPQRFTPNPTEDTATIGGAYSCNAKGLNALRYGSVSDHVEAIQICLPDGRLWKLHRGEYLFDKSGCPLPDGRRLEVPFAREPLLFEALAPRPGLDLIDLFAGSEGMLGTVLGLTLRLTPCPAVMGIMFFFCDWNSAAAFACDAALQAEKLQLTALEFFDGESISRAARLQQTVSRLRQIPAPPAYAAGAVYLEVECQSEDELEDFYLPIAELYQSHGGNEDDTWAGFGEQELEKLRLFRHAVPEAANTAIDETRRNAPGVTKVCVDFTLPLAAIPDMLARYEADIASSGMPGMVFGHMGCGRLHVNLLPACGEDYRRAQALVWQWAKTAWEYGALLCGENGVGKQKRILLTLAPKERMDAAKAVKDYFDPAGRYNPNNLFGIVK